MVLEVCVSLHSAHLSAPNEKPPKEKTSPNKSQEPTWALSKGELLLEPQAFTQQASLLTASGKLSRRALRRRYARDAEEEEAPMRSAGSDDLCAGEGKGKMKKKVKMKSSLPLREPAPFYFKA